MMSNGELMVTFIPFSGYRPSLKGGEAIGDRISPPYDVISDDYLKRLLSKEHNVTNLTLAPDDNGRYTRSRKELEKWIADGSLLKDEDSFYLYVQKFVSGGKPLVRTGIVGILKTEPYENGNVIPHEETFSAVKEDRLNLLRDMETHLESIFGIFEGFSDDLNERIAKASEELYVYEDDSGVEHIYRRISDKNVTKAITKELEQQKMLIADGHHRYETALNYSLENPNDKKKGYVLATLVSSKDPGLVIWPTHRLINSPLTKEDEAIKMIGNVMDLKEMPDVENMLKELPEWQMGLMFRSGRCFVAKYNNKGSDPLWGLDTYVAQELIIRKVYGQGIYVPGVGSYGDIKVSYDAEIDSVIGKMTAGGYDLAVVLNAPSLKAIWDLSAVGKRMPKKTTYFYPKIWSGFVFYKMV